MTQIEPQNQIDTPRDDGAGGIGNYRWVICGLLFLATVVNYTDRQVLGILAPTLETKIGWNEADYGWIVFAFQCAYAVALLLWGRIIDRIGTKLGYCLAVLLWAISSMCHSLARNAIQFGIARFFLGLGEAGNFPAAIKTVAEWFPRKERALAVGIFNAGANVGAIIAPLLVPVLLDRYGWQSAFLATGTLSLSWLALWFIFYAPVGKHPRVSQRELAYIHQDPPESTAKVSWLSLLGYRQTWALVMLKFMTDPVWWFYLFWLPKYLKAEHGIEKKALILPLIVVYVIADIGSITGGWLSGRFLKMGWPLNRGRKTAMLACALCVVPVVFAPLIKDMWTAVLLVALAASAHQGWSANVYTAASDLFPKKVVASIVGIAGFAGAVGGMLFALFTGYFLEWTNKYYTPLFWICGGAYLAALAVFQCLAPRMDEAKLER